ncbi:MAG: hypothetical protein AB7G11_13865, partial [Phycisphaerales bacterium]
NIEQVVVRGPLVGTWTIEVRVFDVPVPGTTGQTYSLGFSTRACPCDWNIDAVVNSQDFYDFASDFFAGNADFDQSGTTTSEDFFAFLTCFVSACQ